LDWINPLQPEPRSCFTIGQTYRVGFRMSQRTNYGLPQTVTVRVGNVALGTFVASTGAYGPKWSEPFTATATSQTIAFWGAPENGQDRMAFIDRVVVATAGPHAAVEMANGNSYAYDPNGNMTMRREMSGTQPFTYTQAWTVDNRLAGIEKRDVTGTLLARTSYAYDGDGTRVRKADPDGTTLYIGPTEISLKYLTPEWTAASGTAADGFDLRKTTMTNGWDAGASTAVIRSRARATSRSGWT